MKNAINQVLLNLAKPLIAPSMGKEQYDSCHQALRKIDGQKDQWGTQNKILTTLGVAYSDMGQLDGAYEYALQAVNQSIRLNDKNVMPVSLNNLACLYLEHNEIDNAIKALKKGLLVTQESGNLRLEALLLNNLANCYLQKGINDDNLEIAESYLDTANLHSRRIKSFRLQGLLYAGVASVLLSLWQVSDESTCYLMENFYWHYVINRQTKTKALQLAMQAVKAGKEYAHPYYWAPFVIMGDWR